MFDLFRPRKRGPTRTETGISLDLRYNRVLQLLKDNKDNDWTEHFGDPVPKDDPIWDRYVEAANAYDIEYVDVMTRVMENLLVFVRHLPRI
ncbi:hypothetical protein FRC02_001961 [Tulasnella sp. 418]|nr:hypothetical protein FRC02_001961 [Tulasnella sp. 418]